MTKPPTIRPAARHTSSAKYRRAFVVTYGRSGSTLLQGVLNAIPGYLIRGENNDLLGEMEEFWGTLPMIGHRGGAGLASQPSSTPEKPFFGYERLTEQTYAAAFGRFLECLLADDAQLTAMRCIGFKEVRYTPENVSDRVDFLRRLYPGCAVIYNIRTPENVVASEFQRNMTADYFRYFNDVLADLASVDPDATLVRYEDVVTGTGSLLELYRFLGEPFDGHAFKSTQAKKHSYHSIAQGSVHSNVPDAVQVAKGLRNVDLFIVDRLARKGRLWQIDGFMIESAAAPNRRFDRLRDDRGRDVEFSADYKLDSPRLFKELKSMAARQARFQVSFEREAARTYDLFFENGELAMTVHEDHQF